MNVQLKERLIKTYGKEMVDKAFTASWFPEVQPIFEKAGIQEFAWLHNLLRESEGNPNAEGDVNLGGAYGLFQVNLRGLGAEWVKLRGEEWTIRKLKTPSFSSQLIVVECLAQGVEKETDPIKQAWLFTHRVERPAESIQDRVYFELFGTKRVP